MQLPGPLGFTLAGEGTLLYLLPSQHLVIEWGERASFHRQYPFCSSLRLCCLHCSWLLPLPNSASYPSFHKCWFLINILYPRLCLSICFQRTQSLTASIHSNVLQTYGLSLFSENILSQTPKPLSNHEDRYVFNISLTSEYRKKKLFC